jgi:hypothetical protein
MSKGRQQSAKPKVKAREVARVPHKQTAEAAPPQSLAPFAMASDGTLFINVSSVDDALAAAHLEGRPVFIGAGLTGDEEQLAREIFDNAGHEMRSRIMGARAKRRVAKEKPEEESRE